MTNPVTDSFDEPLALVIGCGDMGMAIARYLGRRHPLFIVDIDKNRLELSIGTLQHEGYAVTGQICDITDSGDVERLADALSRQNGIKVVAHVAAIGRAAGGGQMVMDVDLLGVHRIANSVKPYLIKGSVMVFISSLGAYQAPNDPQIDTLLRDPLDANFFENLNTVFGKEPDEVESYFMAKKGMNMLAEKLAFEWAREGIRVLSVSPGMIDSTMARTSGSELPVKIENGRILAYGPRDSYLASVPMRRQGTLLEVAAVVDFLASDAASFITGIDIPVDGGSRAAAKSRR